MAKIKVSELFSTWTLKTDEAGLKKIDQTMQSMAKGARNVGLAVAGAAGSIFALVKSTANYGDKALKGAQATGLQTDAYQELVFAMDLAGIKQDEFNQIMGIFNRNVINSTQGLNDQSKAFQRLKISIRELGTGKLKSNGVLLSEIAEAFSQMPDDAEKSALASDLFGRSGQRLLPFLNQGAKGINALRKEARALGIVLSREDLVASEEFNDQLSRLGFALTGVKNRLGLQLLPTLRRIADATLDWFKANKKVIDSNLSGFANGLIKNLESILVLLTGVGIALAAVTAFSVISRIGTLVLGIKSLNAALILTNLLAFGMGTLVLAAVAALGLLAEDIYRFVKGDDSLLGDFLRMLDDMGSKLDANLKDIVDLAKITNSPLGIFSIDRTAGTSPSRNHTLSAGGGRGVNVTVTQNITAQDGQTSVEIGNAAASKLIVDFNKILRQTSYIFKNEEE